ncbi:MAG: integrase [Deltaproteobacteria bacterium]|nr:integrase [Deltaproteobacteria bacterium]
MRSKNSLSRHVHSFFQDYLTRQRNLSPNTVLSYRDTLKLFLRFASIHLEKPVIDLSVDLLDVELVLLFLDHLEEHRKNSAATRNVRLAALHSFFRHVGGRDPLLLDQCRRILDIPLKRTTTPAVDYLEREELEALLHAIDLSKFDGRRDFTLLSLAYQTGARVQEILNLRVCDLQLTPPAWVRLLGKGSKERVIPLWNQTAELLRALLVERNLAAKGTSSVFTNLQGKPLTRWGFRYILQKHVRAAAAILPTLADKHVHPHILRHTTAVHMLQAGVDPNSIRDCLGHANSETTWRYARITMQMKRKAIEALAPQGETVQQPVPIWREDEALLSYLESLGRRNGYVANSQ